MSDFEISGPQDAALALGATGLLADFNAAGVIRSADVHIAQTLGRLGGEHDEQVLLAIALTCRAVRAGSVCLDLASVASEASTAEPSTGSGTEPTPDLPWPAPGPWADAVAASPLIGLGVLRWDARLLYLDRYHEQETQVLDDLTARAATEPPHDVALMHASLDRVFPLAGYDEQRAACVRAASQWTTVITGGPGTGKTTAVAGLLVALAEQHEARGEVMRVAMAAPTGKAAARLQEAVHAAADALSPVDRARLDGLQAGTLHRLLRTHPGNSTRFRHDRHNRLPHDVIVVDETSMVSLTMMSRLLEAVRPDARLILVGDPDQLSSVDAGAVLSDLVRGFEDRADSPVAALRTTHRYGTEIGTLAEALRDGDADAVVAALSAGHSGVEWIRDEDPAGQIRSTSLEVALAVRDAAAGGRADKALEALDRHRLLCAHRDGPYGVRHWNRRIEQWITAETGDPLYESAYVGRPLLVTANDYALGIYNGDVGVVVDRGGVRRVALIGSDGPLEVAPSRLGDVDTMHAMTIHKSQGGQADVVTVLLPDEDSRLLTRELFYTAVTRARTRVRVIGPESAVRAAVGHRAQRATGLARRLADS